nr:DUF3265 domain-containing protein [Vibrio navarrensis]
MHAAWHFWYAVGFGGESGLRKVGLGGIHPQGSRMLLTHLFIEFWDKIFRNRLN